MKQCCFITYENRPNLAYYHEFSMINARYCQRMGYDCIQLDNYHLDIPDYWVKVFLLRDYLQQYNYVVWLDSDAVVQDPTFDVARYFDKLPENYVMACSKEPDHWGSIINAGVILMKSTPMAFQLLGAWIARYNPSRWYKVDGKWKCYGEWAGPDYEQGSIVKLGYEGWKEVIKVEPWQVFCNLGLRKSISKVAHLAAGFKRNYKKVANEIKQKW